jgi:hypothetical protein
VAAAAVFYASHEAEFITGTTLLVDGGMTAGYLQRERNAQPPPFPAQRRDPREASGRVQVMPVHHGPDMAAHAESSV